MPLSSWHLYLSTFQNLSFLLLISFITNRWYQRLIHSFATKCDQQLKIKCVETLPQNQFTTPFKTKQIIITITRTRLLKGILGENSALSKICFGLTERGTLTILVLPSFRNDKYVTEKGLHDTKFSQMIKVKKLVTLDVCNLFLIQ